MSQAAKPARTVLVTRPAHQAAGLMTALSLRGFTPVASPVLELRHLSATVPGGDHDGLVFTSANGVEAFQALDARRDIPVFAVGPATAAAARKAHYEWILAGDQGAEVLAEIISGRLKSGSRVLYPSARDVAFDLETALKPAGIHVDRIVVYEMEPASSLSGPARDAIRAGCRALFFSARTAKIFHALANAAEETLGSVDATFLFNPDKDITDAGWRSVGVMPRESDEQLAEMLDRHDSIASRA